MSIKNDRWIAQMAEKHGMIEPFEPGKESNTETVADIEIDNSYFFSFPRF